MKTYLWLFKRINDEFLKFLLFAFLSIYQSLFAQLIEDFSDNDFTNNPTWTGSTSDFIVNSNQQLQLNASSAGQSYLVTPHLLSNLNDKVWQFWVRQNFAGSAGNYGRVYLIAEQEDLSTNPDGIYIQLGEALANDAVRIMQQHNGTITQICASSNGSIAAVFQIGISIKRLSNGTWELRIDFNGNTDYLFIDSGMESQIPIGDYFGYQCTYTAGNSTRFYLDNIYVGDEIVDTDPPILQTVVVIDNHNIDVLFSEEITSLSAQNSANYELTPFNSITTATLDVTNQALVHLQLTSPLVNGNTYTLTTVEIEDINGNSSPVQSFNFTYLIAEQPTPGDVIINEFMADPTPIVGLPDAEFVEIYNRSSKIFNLSGWKLGDNASFGTVTASNWFLPGEYRVLTPNTSVQYFTNAVGVSSFPSLNNASDDIKIADNNGNIIDQLSYTTAWYHDPSKANGGWTIERINPETPCSDISNWKASIDSTGGTPGIQNSVFSLNPDNTIPKISQCIALSSNTIQVTFNKPIDSLSIQNASITTNPPLTISEREIQYSFSNVVYLTTEETINNSTIYLLKISGFEDCIGHIGNDSTQFSRPSIAEPGDIIINEFMADPSPIIDLPEVEFVEIYNASSKIIDLSNWKLGDNSTLGSFSGGVIYPNEYKILTPNNSVGLFVNAIGVSNFPSLNNAADDIKLIDNNGNSIDQISYTIDWYHDPSKTNGGWTIERINPHTPCSDISNWRASISSSGGTPGYQNSVFNITPDSIIPKIDHCIALSSNSIRLVFNKPIDSLSIQNASISINPPLTILNRQIASNISTEAILTSQEQIITSELYLITITGFEDCSGQIGNDSTTFTLPSTAEPGDILINEFMADPSPAVDLPEVEFVEIYNISNKIIDLSNWKLGDNSSFGSFNGGIIYPNEYKVLTANSNVGQFTNAIGVTNFPNLNNAEDDIVIQNAQGTVIDKISYTTTWYQDNSKKDGGWSIERINPFAPCQSSNNWRASIDLTGGTPGYVNSVLDTTPDYSLPKIVSIEVVTDQQIAIYFNKNIDSNALQNVLISTNPSLTITYLFIPEKYTSYASIYFLEALIPSKIYTLTINGLKDCWGNENIVSQNFILPSNPSIGEVVINELLFDQLTGGGDWIELYNKSDKIIDLKGWKFARYTNEEISDIKTYSKHHYLYPDDYVVVGSDSSFVINNYPAAVLGKFINLALPTLPNDTGSIIVLFPYITPTDTTDQIMDELIYSAKWHFKLLDSKDGKSLERRNPDLPTQEQSNWHTAAESVGFATPGGKNSQYYPSLYSGQMTLANDVISPDNDGFEDVLQVNYQMETTGLLATVSIFDDKGRRIKTVCQNELLGIEGILTWDGIREDGQKALIGTYVILMEAFDIHGGNQFVAKKAFVVAGKM